MKDLLFDFILSSKLNQFVSSKTESYSKYFHISEFYSGLREAVKVEDSVNSTKLISSYLVNDWLRNHQKSDSGFYSSHKSQNTYIGYWCFEAAAVTCIKGLDDSSYRDHPYYPKDLADYYRANQ